jgi:ribonuclease D
MSHHKTVLERPSKDTIRTFPLFTALPHSLIHHPRSHKELAFARHVLMSAPAVGFDTETKPAFINWVAGEGPHVVQFATRDHAFVLRLEHHGSRRLVRDVVEASHITKVGVGVAGDCAALRRKLGVRVRSTFELSTALHRLGYRPKVGLQAAVAIVLGLYLEKPLNVTRSNWARKRLSAKQVRYAANDAYAAVCVFHALEDFELRTTREGSRRAGAGTSSGSRHSSPVDSNEATKARQLGS